MQEKDLYYRLFLILVGFISLYLSHSEYNDSNALSESESVSINVQASTEIINIRGRHDPNAYEFWTSNHRAQFVIEDGIIIEGNSSKFLKIKPGDSLFLKIRKSDYPLLERENAKVSVIEMKAKDQELFSLGTFIANKEKYSLRRWVFYAFTGIFLIINGVFQLKSKFNYLILGLGLLIVLWMKNFQFGLYG